MTSLPEEALCFVGPLRGIVAPQTPRSASYFVPLGVIDLPSIEIFNYIPRSEFPTRSGADRSFLAVKIDVLIKGYLVPRSLGLHQCLALVCSESRYISASTSIKSTK